MKINVFMVLIFCCSLIFGGACFYQAFCFQDDFEDGTIDDKWDIIQGEWEIITEDSDHVAHLPKTSNPDRRMVSWDEFDYSELQITMTAKGDCALPDSGADIGLGFFSNANGDSCYWVCLGDEDKLSIYETIGGVHIRRESNEQVRHDNLVWYNVEILIDNMTVNAKSWELGTTEPQDWQITYLCTEIYGHHIMLGAVYGDDDEEYWFDDVTANSPLPVELANFYVQAERSFVTIQWTTASEINCHKWEVHRSQQEEGEYIKIGELSGHGSTETSHTYQLLDHQVTPGVTYYYKLKQIDFDGSYWWSHVVSAIAGSTIPTTFALYQNYPNPFNPGTQIKYQIPQDSHVALKIFNVTGQEIISLVDDHLTAGSYTSTWNSRDAQGARVSAGIYLCTMKAGDFSQTMKMVLLR